MVFTPLRAAPLRAKRGSTIKKKLRRQLPILNHLWILKILSFLSLEVSEQVQRLNASDFMNFKPCQYTTFFAKSPVLCASLDALLCNMYTT